LPIKKPVNNYKICKSFHDVMDFKEHRKSLDNKVFSIIYSGSLKIGESYIYKSAEVLTIG